MEAHNVPPPPSYETRGKDLDSDVHLHLDSHSPSPKSVHRAMLPNAIHNLKIAETPVFGTSVHAATIYLPRVL